MPYIAAWDEFARAAEKLYLSDPLKCRCVTKYRHCDGKLVMKVGWMRSSHYVWCSHGPVQSSNVLIVLL